MTKKLCDRLIRKEEIGSEDCFYSYELTESTGTKTVDHGISLYSIKIKMTDKNGLERRAEAKDLFSSKAKATAFFEKLVRNLATPIDLKYVVEDEVSI